LNTLPPPWRGGRPEETSMAAPKYPALYQINTRNWLHELGRSLGRDATFDDVPEATLDDLAALGFDWVWLLGIWQTGRIGRQVSLSHPGWLREYQELLADYGDD